MLFLLLFYLVKEILPYIGVSQNVPDGPHKLFLGSIPSYLGEEQVLELLRAFGEVKAFVLVRDSHTGASKGFAFVEYADHDLEEIACQGLTGMEVGDKKLVLQRSSTTGGGFKNNRDGGGLASSAMPMLPMDILQSIGRNLAPPTSVLLLLNMISGIDVQADEDYEGKLYCLSLPQAAHAYLLRVEIYVDIEDEASRHGTIEQIVIPRPKEGEEVPGVGKIFVKFASMDDCIMAQKAIAGRQFNDRAVITAYYDEDKFKNGEY